VLCKFSDFEILGSSFIPSLACGDGLYKDGI
jgi:hypothetical protein